MPIKLFDKKLIFSAPVTEKTSAWGVYSIPRLWKTPDGNMIIRFNGEIDSPNNDNECCPDLFFASKDNGETFLPTGGKNIDIGVLGNVDDVYLKLKNGNSICVRQKEGLKPIGKNVLPTKEFVVFKEEGVIATYKIGDLDKDTYAAELITYDKDGKEISRKDVKIDFPEKEIKVFKKVVVNGEYVEQDCYVKPDNCTNPYVTSIKELKGGTLIGLTYGQNKDVYDRYCGDLFLLESIDGGVTWKLRSKITKNSYKYKFGLVGDGGEASMTIDKDGIIYVVTRTDMSVNHQEVGGTTSTMLFISRDNGITWEDEKEITDSSVTPHILALDNGAVCVVYGRPGVHIIYSTDKCKTFSNPVSVIGKTLTEELKVRDYMSAKYFDMDTYANTFIEKINGDTFLLLYNDMKYLGEDGLKHKAGFTVKVKVIV